MKLDKNGLPIAGVALPQTSEEPLTESYQKNELVRIAKFLQLKNARYNNKTDWIECNDTVNSIVNSFKHRVLDSEISHGHYGSDFYIISESLGNIYGIGEYQYSRGRKADKDRSILTMVNSNKLDSSKIDRFRKAFKSKPLGPAKPIKKEISELSFGTKEYTSKNLTPDEILDVAMAYHKQPIKKLIGRKNDHNIKVANDLSRLLGSEQLQPTKRTGKPILIAVLLKNGLVSKDEYIQLFKDLTYKHVNVSKVLQGAKADTRGASKASRVAAKDMKGEFDDTDESVINERPNKPIAVYTSKDGMAEVFKDRYGYKAIVSGEDDFDTFAKTAKEMDNKLKKWGFKPISGSLSEKKKCDDDVNESKVKYAKTITKSEWDKANKDYKSVIDGVHYLLMNDPKHGTALLPVRLSEWLSEKSDCDDEVNESYDTSVIDQIKDIVKTKSYKTIKDPKTGKKIKVDLFTASVVLKVYETLSELNKKTFCGLNLPAMINVSYKLVNK